MYIYIHTHISTYIHIYTHIYTYIHIYISTCMSCMHVIIHACSNIHVCVCHAMHIQKKHGSNHTYDARVTHTCTHVMIHITLTQRTYMYARTPCTTQRPTRAHHHSVQRSYASQTLCGGTAPLGAKLARQSALQIRGKCPPC